MMQLSYVSSVANEHLAGNTERLLLSSQILTVGMHCNKAPSDVTRYKCACV